MSSIVATCEHCRKQFNYYKNNWHRGKFCSKKCYYDSKRIVETKNMPISEDSPFLKQEAVNQGWYSRIKSWFKR